MSDQKVAGSGIVKKICKIVSNVLLYLFLAVAVLCVIFTLITGRDSDGTANLFGYQMRIVTTDSMAACDQTDVSGFEIKSIPSRSLVFVEKVPESAEAAKEWYSSLKVGDVLTFRYVYTTQVTITHRIITITPKGDGYVIELEGDNKSADSELMTQVIDTTEQNSPNYVIGKVVGQSYFFGFLLSLLRQPIGIVLLVIVPCFIIILLEVIRIVGVVNGDRKQREQEEKKQKDMEIELLKERLAALEQTQNESSAIPPLQRNEKELSIADAENNEASKEELRKEEELPEQQNPKEEP